MKTTTNVQTVAKELAGAFTSDKRDNGGTFYMFKDDALEWIDENDVSHNFHRAVDDRLPDDWVYTQAAHAADSLAEYEDIEAMRDAVSEIADGQVDNSDRAAWLASHLGNHALCDEAVSEGLCDGKDIDETIGVGQYIAIERICNALIDAIEARAEELE